MAQAPGLTGTSRPKDRQLQGQALRLIGRRRTEVDQLRQRKAQHCRDTKEPDHVHAMRSEGGTGLPNASSSVRPATLLTTVDRRKSSIPVKVSRSVPASGGRARATGWTSLVAIVGA